MYCNNYYVWKCVSEEMKMISNSQWTRACARTQTILRHCLCAHCHKICKSLYIILCSSRVVVQSVAHFWQAHRVAILFGEGRQRMRTNDAVCALAMKWWWKIMKTTQTWKEQTDKLLIWWVSQFKRGGNKTNKFSGEH